ncbi:MAG TPA: PilX N-terminal domain-containing pilus assembly protein [Candidatus Acidoferrales bacterium]|nr:PilX N-terminal domain-containing pilus assembly protein [Candidatus Acidoferrales bacterium]
MRSKRENGIALLTVLLIMILVSAMIVGMSWMVMSDQRLGGNNQFRESAFYGAEAGMEKLTADMGNAFVTKGFITAADLTTPPVTVPPPIPGIQYMNSLGVSTYTVTCPGCPAAPVTTNANILPPSFYAGMQGLITPYTLTVAAQTGTGSEVKLQRQIQLVAIPVFQFGIFSQTDLSFFAGPLFDFGGRVHTNGNLWLAANPGPLYLGDKITVAGQVIRSNLENGYPGGGAAITAGGTYGGTVNISSVPLPIPPNPVRPPYVAGQWNALSQVQGSVGGTSVYGAVSTVSNTVNWTAAVPVTDLMIASGVPPLNLTTSALGGITSPITLIERPTVGEAGTNPAEFSQQYFSGGGGQVSLRILLDDYGPGGTCASADMLALDVTEGVTPTVPVDLATLAFGAGQHFTAAPAWYNPIPAIPLPTSGAGGAAYNPADGYWVTKGYPIITGCIKVEYETAGGAFTDVTQEILRLGFTGANLNPVAVPASPALPTLPADAPPASILAPSGCANISANAIIRLARVRDNTSSGGCGTLTDIIPTDYWPNVLYDPREGVSRDVDPSPPGGDPSNPNKNPYITAQGVMNYIELDVNNLQRWFAGTIGASGGNASHVGGYEVYFSDRRGNQIDPTAGINVKTGSFGFNDIINGPTDPANGCPNNALDSGEDLVGDGVLRTYGGRPVSAGPLVAGDPPLLGYAGFAGAPYIVTGTVPDLIPNTAPLCGAAAIPPSPDYFYKYTQEARENPPVFFRRALKIVDGGTINLGTLCFGAAPNPPCGLTIVSENPVYIQGEFNDGGVNNGTWTGPSVAASVAADSVTMLSNSWNDVNSFISPYNGAGQTGPNDRPASTTSYRVAIIGGKGIPFVQPAGTAQDYGTDGGLHNFLRYIEYWTNTAGVQQTLYYRGSLVSFYYSAQAIGPYKCCVTVYSPPVRTYTFDENFINGPQWLPPRTPTLKSINTVGFTQEILPTQ